MVKKRIIDKEMKKGWEKIRKRVQKNYKVERHEWSFGSSKNPFKFFPTSYSVNLGIKERLGKKLTLIPNLCFETKNDAKQFKLFLEHFLPKIIKHQKVINLK